MNDLPDFKAFEAAIGYTFNNKTLLENALRHSSYVNELTDKSIADNERLEFLGDAVVNLVVGDLLMAMFPDYWEGELSRIRSGLVNEETLAEIARSLSMGEYILLGRGEKQAAGHDKSSILSDAYEALVAAVYLDGGFDVVKKIVHNHFATRLPNKHCTNITNDNKSMLQELTQNGMGTIPRYKVVEETGPDHDKTFKICLNVGDVVCYGLGKSKKAAEQDAAGRAILKLQ